MNSRLASKIYKGKLRGAEIEKDHYTFNEKYIIRQVPGIIEGRTIVIEGNADSFWEGIERKVS